MSLSPQQPRLELTLQPSLFQSPLQNPSSFLLPHTKAMAEAKPWYISDKFTITLYISETFAKAELPLFYRTGRAALCSLMVAGGEASVGIQKCRLFHSVYLKHLITASACVSLSACCRQLVRVVRVVRLRLVWLPVPLSSVHHFISRGQPVHGQHHGEPSLCFGLQLYTRWD